MEAAPVVVELVIYYIDIEVSYVLDHISRRKQVDKCVKIVRKRGTVKVEIIKR